MRLEMAEVGLPKSGTIGYEIFDREESLGTSSFVQNVNHLRALEGELARTIGSLAQVVGARVHLVLPKRKLFSRENDEPSASIMLSLAGSGRLPAGKVRAIQQLVAAAVSGLSPERVSIVDDRGNLLARADTDPEIASATNLDERKMAYENRLSQTIENMVAKYVGDGKVRAEVTVDMDYDRFTENSEKFDPDGQVIRSAQTVNTGEEEEGTGPQPVTAASNLPNAGADAGGKTTAKSNRKEETTNYEISKTVKMHVHESGSIKRLSVAVMVDGLYKTEKGKEPTYVPRPDAEMKQLTKLVQTAIGFNKERGDNVEVINMRFAPLETSNMQRAPEPFLGLSKQDYIRIAEVLIMSIIALLILMLVVKPLVNRLLEGLPTPVPLAIQNAMSPDALLQAETGVAQIAATASSDSTYKSPNPDVTAEIKSSALDHMVSVKQIEGQIRASSLKTVGDIIDSHTEESVAVIRNWITKPE
jgi:flagellar M-ring protein FliF